MKEIDKQLVSKPLLLHAITWLSTQQECLEQQYILSHLTWLYSELESDNSKRSIFQLTGKVS